MQSSPASQSLWASEVTVFGSVRGFDVEEDEPLQTSQMFYTCEFCHQHMRNFGSITFTTSQVVTVERAQWNCFQENLLSLMLLHLTGND